MVQREEFRPHLFCHQVVSNSLQPHGLQDTRLPCPSLSPWIWLNSCPLSWWCYPTISSVVSHFSSCPQSFPVSESPSELTFCIRWPKYWSFSNSPFNEYPRFLVEILKLTLKDQKRLILTSYFKHYKHST